MNSILDRISTKRYLMMMNIGVLAIHISLIVVFYTLYTMPMVYVNIACVICYCVCFFLVAKEWVRAYVLVTFAGILIHTFLAVWCVGSNAGFQMYYLACMAIVLFAHYFSVHIGIKPCNGPLLGAVCCVLYILTMVFSRSRSPLYPLSFNEQYYLTMYNVLLTFLFIFTFFSLLTLVASHNEMKLVRQASHDNLTGLVNRHYLTKYMHEIHETGKLENYWLAILDIDDFKMINDQYGHLCGDFVLRAVAEIIRECCGTQMVCRWGGEEFMIVGIASEQEGGMIALLEKVRNIIATKEFVYDNTTRLHLTVTAGIARYQRGQSLNAWVDTADNRLYNGKQTGKNQVVSADA